MRTTVVLTLGVIGAGPGLLGDIIFWQGTPQTPPILAVAGLPVGLLLGWLLSATFPASPAAPSDRPQPVS